VSPLAVPPFSHLIRNIFSGTQNAKNSKNDHADASDINHAHFSDPRSNQRLALSAVPAMKSDSRPDPHIDFGLRNNCSDVTPLGGRGEFAAAYIP
jgi:hypothetical protein